MKTFRIKTQIVLAFIGIVTALSMCGSGDTVDSGIGFQALLLVLLSGALLLNVKIESDSQE